ncbi:MAG: sigma-54 dependent transcriptional regulator [Acidobacteria bacterium]|nr:sigma-54 dependent transcriptional regulator [Acidobacteriota bacterium]
MKILLAWIGNTDLNAAAGEGAVGSGPIGAAATKLTYDRIILLSNYAAKEGSRYIRWLRQQTESEVELHQVSLSSPTDFGDIYKAVVRTVGQVHAKLGNNVRLTFHLSPGTPAMSAVWIIVAKTRFPAELIESSREVGVRQVSLPFDISAEFIPDLLRYPDEELKRLTPGLPPEAPEFGDIVHRSKQMKEVIGLARLIAVHKLPVLIEGESGTGKELMARAIHVASPWRKGPFIAVNCGAIPADLVESELFGHEKGAFTGVDKKRDGHFIKANGGTIFLDEVGELPLPTQVKLLRVLQEQEVTPLGSSLARRIDVRVISATNRTLIDEVAQGNFREDLFYRLAVFILRLPSVREREGDIGLLLEKILDEIKRETPDLISEHKRLSPGARNFLLNYHWPGNVREMKNTLLRAAVLSSGPQITETDIRQAIFTAPTKNQDRILNRPLGKGFDLQQTLSEVAQHYLRKALEQAHGNKSEAAKLVGLPSYQTLTNWLKKYDVEIGI